MPPVFAFRPLALVTLAGLLSCRPSDSAGPADMVVYGRVWTGDSAKPLFDFDLAALDRREIVVGPHCFGCTAGAGSSCGGATV